MALRYDEAWPVSWGTVRDVLPESRLAVDLDSGGWLIVPARMAAHETTETDT